MTVRGNINPLLMGGDDGYQISRSVRLRSSASAYFSWTPGTSATSTQKLTYSAWIKRGILSTVQHFGLNGAVSAGARDAIRFTTSDALEIFLNEASSAYLATTQLFRDPSAWYHIVVSVDTTQATSSDRIKVYVNGAQVTAFSTATYPTQNYNFTGWLVSGKAQNLGRSPEPNYYFDGYQTQINVIDGQQLLPTSFGAFDAITGVWNPKAYSGTYGNNGFYLNFKDPTSTTTIGYDYSGNSNNWTANNISVTAGTTYDSMVDVPTNYGADTGVGGTVRGNYCTFNPLFTGGTLASGNLDFSASAAVRTSLSTIAVPTSGKWYWEVTVTAVGNSFQVGIGGALSSGTNYLGSSSDAYSYSSNALKYNNNSSTSYGASYTTNDVIGVAYDADAATLVFYKNNTSQGTAFSSLSGTFFPAVSYGSSSGSGSCAINFGQRSFSYTAPSGFKALCTQNFTTPTISNGANYVAATLYTGTGASQTVSNAVNSISFQPDMVWVKSRSAATDHKLTDSVRGVTKALISDTSGAETTDTTGLTAFGASGFTVGTDTVYNNSGATYVGWQWKASGSTVSNTQGSITSTVSANTTAGFSVVGYTGNGTSGATIGHGLGATASFIILKRRDGGSGYSWYVQHPTLGPTKALFLDSTNGAATSANYWNNTAPTSTVFSVGNDTSLNASGGTYVAYCWSQITGYSAFTTYTGNGSGDGPFVYCGFRPRYLIIKRYDAAGDPWWAVDSTRSPYNQTILALRPSGSNVEDSGGNANFDFLANGFKARTSGGGNGNESGATYIVAAFAENPFTISRAR